MRYVETLHKRGYRLIAEVVRLTPAPRPAPRAVPRLKLTLGLLASVVALSCPLGQPPVIHALALDAFESPAGDDAAARAAVRVVHGLRVHGLGARGAPTTPTSGADAYALFRHGRALLAEGHLAGLVAGQEMLERAVQVEPGFALGRSGLALALAQRGLYTGDRRWSLAGVAEARRAVREQPDLPEAHQALARNLLNLGRLAQAQEAVSQTLALRPNFPMALGDRRRLLLLRGRLVDAVAATRALLALDVPGTRAINRSAMGTLLLAMGLDAEAGRWFAAALAHDPRLAGAHGGLAQAELFAGRPEAAVARVERLVEAEPGCAPCLLEAARVTHAAGRVREALGHSERAARLPDAPAEARLLQFALGADRSRAPLAAARRGAERDRREGDEGWRPAWLLAAVAALEGDAEASARAYRQAVAAGRLDPRADRLDPVFASVRHHRAFLAALAEAEDRVARARVALGPPPTVPGAQR